jgi:tetratricopeptide (TPR) repeat protein
VRLAAAREGDKNNLVRAYRALLRLGAEAGDLAAVRALGKEALSSSILKTDDRAQAAVRLGAAASLRRLGRLSEAGAELTLARGLGARAKDRAIEARALGERAELTAIGGDIHGAGQHLAEAAALLARLSGPGLAPAALSAARAARLLKDFPRARRFGQQALRSHETRRARVAVATSLVELSRIEQDAGDRRAAAGWAEEAIRRLQEEGRPRSAAMTRWAWSRTLAAWGEHAEAERHRAEAEQILARQGDRYSVARLKLAGGQALVRLGRSKDALVPLAAAAKELEALGERYGAGEARILVAQSRASAGEPAEALEELTQALDHSAAVQAPELTFRAYALLGYISDRLLDRGAQAERFHRGAVTALEQVRSSIDPLGEVHAGAEEAAYYELARVAVRQFRHSGDPGMLDGVLAAVERSRSRQLLHAFSRVGASLADSLEDRRRVRTLAGEERFIAQAMQSPGGTPALRSVLFAALRAAREARAKIEGAALRIDAAHPTPATTGILKGALGDAEALLIYLVGRGGSLLIAITNREAQVVELPSGAELAKAVEAFRLLVDGAAAPSSKAVRASGGALRKLLLDPVRAHLKGKSKLYLVLSGPLWSIPFAALPDGEGESLGTRYAFVRVPSPAGWLKLRDTPRAQSATKTLRVLALADGALGSGSSPLRSALRLLGHTLRPSADALPDGRAVLAVASLREGARPGRRRGQGRPAGQTTKLELDPLESSLRKDGLTDARWVHFATPLVLPARMEGPLQPALVLAGGSGEAGDDGLLLLGEILGLSMDAELFSVAELDSGRGAPHPLAADSFARALQIAGVKSVLLPRQPRGPRPAGWQSAFLQVFYRRLAAGDGVAAAQLAANRSLAIAFPGDPRPLGAFSLFGAD